MTKLAWTPWQEQVVYDLRLRGLGAHLLFERPVHVHDHRLEHRAALGAEQLKEGPYPFPGALAPDPQDSFAGQAR